MTGYKRKRGKRSWEVTVYRGRLPDGKPDRIIRNVKGSAREADEAQAELVRQVRTGSTVDDRKMTVKNFLESWLRDVAAQLAAKTYERYAQIINLRAIPAIGHLPLSKVQPVHIQGLYSEWMNTRLDGRKGKLAARSVMHHHRVLRNAFQHAVRLQLIARNPFDSVKPPKCGPTKVAVLDESEAAKLLRAATESPIYTPVAIALLTGLRRGEVLALRWSDIDWERRLLSVRQAIVQTKDGLRFKDPKTRSSKRTVSMSPTLIDVLRKHRVRQGQNKWKFKEDYAPLNLVIAEEDGSPMIPQRLSDRFRTLITVAGVTKVRLHDLRHSLTPHTRLGQGSIPRSSANAWATVARPSRWTSTRTSSRACKRTERSGSIKPSKRPSQSSPERQ
jgi:integrase